MSDGMLVLHEELLGMAKEASGRAYAPYSGYRVGAALLCRDGEARFLGCNVENASYGLTLCAERAAAVCAVAAGHQDFALIAIYADGPELPVPCGACRQFLAEFNHALVVVVSNERTGRTFRLSELLPHSFGGAALPGRQGSQVPQRGGAR